MGSLQSLKTFMTVTSLAARAQVHRDVVIRLSARGELQPDALLEFGQQTQPLFIRDRALDVLRLIKPAPVSGVTVALQPK
jgi:hypothetical protein